MIGIYKGQIAKPNSRIIWPMLAAGRIDATDVGLAIDTMDSIIDGRKLKGPEKAMSRKIAAYMKSAVRATDSGGDIMSMGHIDDTVEALMMQRLSAELASRGIDDVGVRVPVDAISPGAGMAGLGKLLPMNWASSIRARQQKKSEKAKRVVNRLMPRIKSLAHTFRARKKAGRDARQVKRELTKLSNQAVVAAKEADAPTITRKEVMESVRPAIATAAKAIASGIEAKGKAVRRRGDMFSPRSDNFWRQDSDVPFNVEREGEYNFPGLGQAVLNIREDFFPVHDRTDWDFTYGEGDF